MVHVAAHSLGTTGSPITKLGGNGAPVEIDETFIGGKVRNMHKSRKLRIAQERTAVRNADAAVSAYGSVVGKLEAISVHRGNEFRMWDKNTGRPVRCLFSPERETEVKDRLRGLVLVAGIVQFNTAGLPISLQMEELEMYAERDLPSIAEMSGLVDDFTAGRTLKKYLEDTADD